MHSGSYLCWACMSQDQSDEAGGDTWHPLNLGEGSPVAAAEPHHWELLSPFITGDNTNLKMC